MSGRNPYTRPMSGWWLKNPFYVRYMVRESTAIFVTLYAFVLLFGLASLVKGQASWETWLTALTSPLAVIFHVVAMLAALYHTVTWFKVSPKVTPPLFYGENRVPDLAITGVQYVIAAIVYLVILVVAWT